MKERHQAQAPAEADGQKPCSVPKNEECDEEWNRWYARRAEGARGGLVLRVKRLWGTHQALAEIQAIHRTRFHTRDKSGVETRPWLQCLAIVVVMGFGLGVNLPGLVGSLLGSSRLGGVEMHASARAETERHLPHQNQHHE